MLSSQMVISEGSCSKRTEEERSRVMRAEEVVRVAGWGVER